MIKKISISPYHDIYTNIALEKEVFNHFDGQDTLLLWSNENCVVCGNNQNIYSEVNLDYAKKNNIAISRRYSGGGAVYQDRENLNYTIITKCQDIDKVLQTIIEPLHALGINAVISGRNDIMVDGKKISGFAYFADADTYMYHGTLLVNVNIENLVQVLSPSPLKLKHNGIDSIKKRVQNISQIKDITVEALANYISHYHINRGAISTTSKLQDIKLMEKLKSEAWIYGESPKFSYQDEFKDKDGIYTIYLDVESNIIVNCQIFSDSLIINDTKITTLKQKLIGVKFNNYNKIKMLLHS